MGLTLGEDSVIQAPMLQTTLSQCALFLPKMSIQTDTIVLDNIHWKICNHYDTETPDKWY